MTRLPARRGGLAVDGQAAAPGEEMRELLLMPDGRGLMAATGDCRLLFFTPQVLLTALHASPVSIPAAPARPTTVQKTTAAVHAAPALMGTASHKRLCLISASFQ